VTTVQLATRFEVVGRPAPQGSKVSLGKGRLKESSKYLDTWRNDVRNAGLTAAGEALLRGPVLVEIVFMIARPKNHHVSGDPSRPLKENAPFWHTSTPDKDKLERSTNDALTGVVWVDDCQVAATLSQKIYVEPGASGGALISIWLLDDQELLQLAAKT
jgi:Holliday junction resolvase RusA-like endonuclease